MSSPNKSAHSKHNKVLQDSFQKSNNFYESDQILQHFLKQNLSEPAMEYMESKLQSIGSKSANEMNKLSMLADKNPPVLLKRDAYGEELNEIEFHPAYESLKKIAVESEMFRVKWEPSLRSKFVAERHRLGFASGYLFVMAETGLFCPLCMTDGLARIIDRFASKEDKDNLLPKIATENSDNLFTGAMFLTEKAGGSDVGANLVQAKHIKDDLYELNGEKWFCSNANAALILALARINPEISGTKGLSIFLIEKQKANGSKNHRNVVRLKDKIGVRSMASAEIILENTEAKIIGKPGEGFKIMTEMINLSRLYNSVTASSIIRRALIEAYQFLSHRKTFGKIALDHSMLRDKMAELATIHQLNFYFTWRTITALDKADNGNQSEKTLLRLLTPMLKKSTAMDAVYACREAMEAIGGIAYIEESVIPKLLRDALVLPIWEGAGNIMTLDMLRASYRAGKHESLSILFREISANLEKGNDDELKTKLHEIQNLLPDLLDLERDDLELNAKSFFEELTKLYQISLLYFYKDEISQEWIDPAIDYARNKFLNRSLNLQKSISRKTVEQMIAWKV